MFCIDYFLKRNKELSKKIALGWELTAQEREEHMAIIQAMRFISNVQEERIENAKSRDMA
jgi:hypothetical protein